MQAQSANNVGFSQPVIALDDWRAAVRESWRIYLVDTLGLPAAMAQDRAEKEINRALARETCDALEQQGMSFPGKRVLDLGCGHGTLAIELASRGADVVGVEPGQQWREVAIARAAEMPNLQVSFIDADATCLPFDDSSFDYIISLQVLEHVKRPYHVAPEVRRLLRPEGKALISCENYLAFREPHYKIFWLPLMPKWLGAIYLKVRKRNPEFLLQHITYTTSLRLIYNFLSHGLWSSAWGRKRGSNLLLQYVWILLKQRKTLFRVGFYHIFQPIEQVGRRHHA
jgi:2-polyprenyl-3-methyl-5-hydroxy-6-metoxy-1,4-benzoquinol methylase